MSQQLEKILLPKNISWRNIKNSPRYTQKTSKIMDFLYNTPPIMVTWQAFRADEVSKIILKVIREDIGKKNLDTCKKSYWLHLPFYLARFLRLGGGTPRCY